MAIGTKYELHASILCTVSAVAGIIYGYYVNIPLVAVISMYPAAIYVIFYVNEPTTSWSKWGLFVSLNIEAGLLVKNIMIDVAHYLSPFASNIPVMDMRLVMPIILIYFSYITARKTQGLYTRSLALLLMVCSMAILFVVDIHLRSVKL